MMGWIGLKLKIEYLEETCYHYELEGPILDVISMTLHL